MMENTTSLRFLCYNVDHTFIAYLMAAAEPVNLSLDICKSSHEVRQKIASSAYNAFLIDITSSDTEIVDLINAFRQKFYSKAPIAVISGPFHDEKKLLLIKEQCTIDYNFQKPIFPQQVDAFLNNVVRPKPEAASPSNKLQDLKRNYDKTIFDKIDLLTKLVKAVQNHPEKEELEELKNAAHKIGGSAGSYGYQNVSSLCKELDRDISEKVKTVKTIDSKWLASLDDFLANVKAGFQTTTQTGPPTYIISSFVPRSSIFVVEYDLKFLDLLVRVGEQFSIDLHLESDPKKALERLKAPDFNPKAIAVAQKYPNSPLTGYDIIQYQRQRADSQTSVYALILDHDDLDTRFEAMNQGVNYIFHRPLSAYDLLRSLKDALDIRALQNYRVLVLDDDIDFCNFVAIMLAEIGLTVKTIQDSSNLIPTLQAFNPHILLLDLVLPKYDGLNLLKTLRQDAAFNHLIIVVVTSSDESATRLSAYSARADDILYKPLDKSILQTRILGLIERQASFGTQQDPLNRTGLTKVRSLTSKLHEYLVKPSRHNQYLALFEIDRFADWVAKQGYAAANAVMVNIGNQLQYESNDEMSSYSYNSSKFALIFDGPTMAVIEPKMYNFLTQQVQRDPHLNLAFNCCILPISQSFGTAQDLLQAAEQGIYEARQKERTPVNMITLIPKDGVDHHREVVLIDPDEELLRILKNSFESHGLSVKTFTDAESALSNLLARKETQIPALIIAERKLPDMDGLEMFNRLKARFKGSIPLYFLTVYSSDKDVSEGLRQGAIEYVAKPFNLSILIQKALKSIFKDEER